MLRLTPERSDHEKVLRPPRKKTGKNEKAEKNEIILESLSDSSTKTSSAPGSEEEETLYIRSSMEEAAEEQEEEDNRF